MYSSSRRLKQICYTATMGLCLMIWGCNAPMIIYDLVEAHQKNKEFEEIRKRNHSFVIIADQANPSFMDIETDVFNICTKVGYISKVVPKKKFRNISVSSHLPKSLQEIEKLKKIARIYPADYIYIVPPPNAEKKIVRVFSTETKELAACNGDSFGYFTKWFNDNFPETLPPSQPPKKKFDGATIIEIVGKSSQGITKYVQNPISYCDLIVSQIKSSKDRARNVKSRFSVCKKGSLSLTEVITSKKNGCIMPPVTWKKIRIKKNPAYREILNLARAEQDNHVIILHGEFRKIKRSSIAKRFNEPSRTICVKGFVYSKEKDTIVGTVFYDEETYPDFYDTKICKFTEYLLTRLKEGKTTIHYNPIL